MRLTKMILSVSAAVASLLLSTNPHAATNGRNIAFSCRDIQGFQNICYYDVLTQTITQITFGADYGVPSCSPTGNVLAVQKATIPRRTPPPPTNTIFVMNADGTRLTSIANNGATPSWSPDGTKIAFAAPSSTTGLPEIWVMRPDGSKKTQLTAHPADPVNPRGFVKPTWSPDNKSIAYAALDLKTGHSTLWIITADGKNPRQLTTATCGTVPCVNVDTDGNRINLAGSSASPAWSPTGDRIAFWSGTEGQAGQIWIINLGGGDTTQLTVPPPAQSSANNDDPAWSPDGAEILFTTIRRGILEMWIMNSDGSSQEPLVPNTAAPLPGLSAWEPKP